MMTLILPFRPREETVRRRLETLTGRTITLTLTENATSLISVKAAGRHLNVRLHRIFLHAGPDVLEEVGRFLKERKGKTPLIRDYIKRHAHELPEKRPRQERLCATGRYYDLEEIFRELNRVYFNDNVTAAITWGHKRRSVARKKTLGSYSSQANIIRISPDLDRKTTPRYVVEHVVHHEMLHAYLGAKVINGRKCFHYREFRDREKAFRDYEKAVAWCS
jgi:hypothetical protein